MTLLKQGSKIFFASHPLVASHQLGELFFTFIAQGQSWSTVAERLQKFCVEFWRCTAQSVRRTKTAQNFCSRSPPHSQRYALSVKNSSPSGCEATSGCEAKKSWSLFFKPLRDQGILEFPRNLSLAQPCNFWWLLLKSGCETNLANFCARLALEPCPRHQLAKFYG